jgi:hypothetical protein
MNNEKMGINVKATLRLEKYPDGATQEQIDKGLVKPIEVIISEDDFMASEDNLKDMGFNI